MNHEQQWFPGLEPKNPPRPGKITVSYAEPMTIEEKEGMRDGVSSDRRNGEDPRILGNHDSKNTVSSPPSTQTSPEPVCAKPASATSEEVKKVSGVEKELGGCGWNTDRGRNSESKAPDSKKGNQRRLFFVKIASTLLAALAALMSWYYSFEWFSDKLPSAWRFMLPIIIVGCSVMLPQVALIFLNKKGVKFKGASILVFCVGLLASGFSMLSTIAGIYNANSESINRRSAAIVSAQSDTDARAELARISEELSRLNREIDSTQAKVDAIPTEDTLKPDSQALMRRLNNAKRGKQDYETQYKEAQKRIEAARATGSTAATVREDFNVFLGRQFKIDAGAVEFGMAAAPALLLDVVAPILSAVALFL